MPEKSNEGRIYINDILGRQVKAYKLNKGYNTILLNAAQMKKGVFFITMFVEGIVVERKKIHFY